MKILIDECVPRKLKRHLSDHECITVPEAGLAGKDNGELLSAAEKLGFDVFLTLDKDFQYEQSLTGRAIAVLIFRAKSSQIDDLLPLVPRCLAELRSIKFGQLVRIET
jgi:predicted nuclease of predicted toxin-antitoxin system